MKWIIRIVAVVVLLVIVAVVAVVVTVDSLAKSGIERSATLATGVQTNVEGVRIGLLGGTFNMTGLRLANPQTPAFDTPEFITLENTDASVTLASLRKDVIEIPKVHLDGLHLTIERKDDQENYKVILENLQQLAKDEPRDDGKKYVARELLVTNVQLTLAGYPGMNKTLNLADIHMTDVGSGGNPVTRSQITGLVIREVFRQIMQNPDLLPGMLVAGLGEGLQGLGGLGEVGVQFVGDITDQAGRVVGEVTGAVGDIIGGVGGAVGEGAGGAVQDAAEGVGDAVRGLGEGLGGLLGGQKKEEEKDE